MKILYIITQGEQGGAQKSILDLASKMKNNHEVFIATGLVESEDDKWLHNELVKKGIPEQNLFNINSLQREIHLVKDLKAIFEMKELIKKVKPDVVHLHSSKAGVVGGWASYLSRTPSVYTVHGFVFLEPMNILKKEIYIFLEFAASFLRSFTILITQKDIDVGRKQYILRSRDKYKLIYNGISLNKEEILYKEEARKFLFERIGKEDKGGQIVGTVSNLYKTKGLEYLIESGSEVLKSKPNTIFMVIGFGDESYKKELESKIKSLGLENNFFLVGKVNPSFRYLKAFDVFTLTSVKEGLPYTLLEASSAGLPIVATNVGGIPEMKKYLNIDLVETKNIKDITNAIMENLNNAKSIPAGIPEVYSIENMVKETENVYKQIWKTI